MKRACELCGREIEASELDVHQRASGWARPRDKGLNGLRLAEREERFAHGRCVDRIASGVSLGQGSLL